ncbi:BON domain-containing protein, partial [Paraburkholderia polaris]
TGAAASASKASKAMDRALAKRVRRALAKTSGMVLTNISVRARDGAVTLVGSVPSAALVGQAAQVAGSVDGVSSVTNRLSVRIDPRSFNGR